MSSATATPNDRSYHSRSPDRRSAEVVYRRYFSTIAAVPLLLSALILAFAVFEHFRTGSIPPAESAILSVVGPFLIVLSLMWAIVVWYGTCVCLGEATISLCEMSLLFRSRARMVLWDEVKDVSLSGGGLSSRRRAVVVTLSEGGSLIIKGIPEPEYLCRAIKLKLPR